MNRLFAILAAMLAVATSARADTFTVCAPQGTQVTIITETVVTPPLKTPSKKAPKKAAVAKAVDCTQCESDLAACRDTAPTAAAALASPAAAIVPPPAPASGRPASGVTRTLTITTALGGR